MPKKKAAQSEPAEHAKNPAAVALGRLGGQRTAARGPDYYRKIAAKRKRFGGGKYYPADQNAKAAS